MIHQASTYYLKQLPSASREAYGLRVLTTRSWLRGVSKEDIDYWVPDAGPSTILLRALRAGQISPEMALARYEDEQRRLRSCRVVRYRNGQRASDQVVARPALDVLRQLEHQHGTITLLCWEPEPHPCHRHHLRALLLEGTPCALHPGQRRVLWFGGEPVCVRCAIAELQRRQERQTSACRCCY